MIGAHRKSKPSFLWQAILILLPVAVLSVIGWISLRKDRLLARQQAEERARVVADDLADLINRSFFAPETLSNAIFRFEVEPSGRLISPLPYEVAPDPVPLDVKSLDSEQKRLWLEAQSLGTSNRERATAALRHFLDLNPPEIFAATAHFQLGSLLEASNAASEKFSQVLKYHSEIRGESGLPLQPLARWKLLSLESSETNAHQLINNASVESFCSNIVCFPTALTPELLRQAENLWKSKSVNLTNLAILKWRGIWEKNEASRQLFAAVAPNLYTNVPLKLLNPPPRSHRR